ncbi:hypothetical protein H4R34_004158 [Dimargaris verticillata]|uniref:Cyclin N-terminal domain-containing protein n=1 Tax=Dimargaris verticillata TaxID=2761393 RepID=A0A9W8B121_9FUNG|nr:hypothetical protein H4R34_004158 [Dimargaris verticillata]
MASPHQQPPSTASYQERAVQFLTGIRLDAPPSDGSIAEPAAPKEPDKQRARLQAFEQRRLTVHGEPSNASLYHNKSHHDTHASVATKAMASTSFIHFAGEHYQLNSAERQRLQEIGVKYGQEQAAIALKESLVNLGQGFKTRGRIHKAPTTSFSVNDILAHAWLDLEPNVEEPSHGPLGDPLGLSGLPDPFIVDGPPTEPNRFGSLPAATLDQLQTSIPPLAAPAPAPEATDAACLEVNPQPSEATSFHSVVDTSSATGNVVKQLTTSFSWTRLKSLLTPRRSNVRHRVKSDQAPNDRTDYANEAQNALHISPRLARNAVGNYDPVPASPSGGYTAATMPGSRATGTRDGRDRRTRSYRQWLYPSGSLRVLDRATDRDMGHPRKLSIGGLGEMCLLPDCQECQSPLPGLYYFKGMAKRQSIASEKDWGAEEVEDGEGAGAGQALSLSSSSDSDDSLIVKAARSLVRSPDTERHGMEPKHIMAKPSLRMKDAGDLYFDGKLDHRTTEGHPPDHDESCHHHLHSQTGTTPHKPSLSRQYSVSYTEAPPAPTPPSPGQLGAEPSYNPNYLDDPDIQASGSRGSQNATVGQPTTASNNLSGFVGSIIPHNKPSELKRELNELFRQKHGAHVDPSITLSKIRNLKLRLIQCAQQADSELSSVAKAFVYLEKLILSRRVVKENRRCIAGVCLLLAVKVNEPHGEPITQVLNAIQKVLGISSEVILQHEFTVYADLHFAVYIPINEMMPHLRRILDTVGYHSLNDYIGNDVDFYLK